MSLYNGPPRPGARGGRGEFSWDNVKSDKDREFYLGHSVKATTGRWQKGKDVFWYTRGKDDGGVTQDELAAVKAREAEMMAEALGLKPKSSAHTNQQPALEKHEVERLLKGTGDEQAAGADADRIKGLGFNSGAAVAVREEVHEVMAGTVQQPGPGKLLTLEQLAALAKASDAAAAAGKPAKDKKHKKHKKKEKREHKKKHKRSRSPDSRSRSRSSDSRDRHHSRHRRQEQQQQQHVEQPSHRAQQPSSSYGRSRHEESLRSHPPHQQERYGGVGASSRDRQPQRQQQQRQHDRYDSRQYDSRERDRDRADRSGRYRSRSRSRSRR